MLNASDRAIIGALANALYEANSDPYQSFQHHAFGSIMGAITHTVSSSANRAGLVFDDIQFERDFFDSWAGDGGEVAADLVQALINAQDD